ncbi:MAG TPA: hypothetical protein VJ250_08125, partial [Nitrososphaeraceae archaeon]|nr:hypothetical protein [Nitrososphaeraceae archaeon]
KRVDLVGFDQQLNSHSSAAILEGCRELRSWVQIHPPGPLFPVSEIRYCSELDFNNCQTNSAASQESLLAE